MSIVFLSVFPVIFILALGNFLRKKEFLPNEFWGASDKLTYYILFPSLIITKVSHVQLDQIDLFKLVLFVFCLFILTALLSGGVYKITQSKGNQFSSIYQSIVRFNSYIYFAIAAQLWGNDGLSLSALIAGVTIPIVNVTSIASFSVGGREFSGQKVAKSIIKNPLIIATLIGFIANYFSWLLPEVLLHTLEGLSKAALPLALLSVGASIQIRALIQKHDDFPIQVLWFSSITRLLIVPFLALGLTYLLQIDGLLQKALVLFSAIPTATSAYILSKQMGGDAKLMASLITFQTVFSAGSLILWIIILIKL